MDQFDHATSVIAITVCKVKKKKIKLDFWYGLITPSDQKAHQTVTRV